VSPTCHHHCQHMDPCDAATKWGWVAGFEASWSPLCSYTSVEANRRLMKEICLIKRFGPPWCLNPLLSWFVLFLPSACIPTSCCKLLVFREEGWLQGCFGGSGVDWWCMVRQLWVTLRSNCCFVWYSFFLALWQTTKKRLGVVVVLSGYDGLFWCCVWGCWCNHIIR
jgi:hypothetical protein